MFWTDCPLMRAQQSAFDQSGDAMNAWHADMGRIASVRNNNPVVFVGAFRQVVVASPPVGQNLGTFLGYIADESRKDFARDVRQPAHPHATKSLWRMNLKCNGHDLLFWARSSSFTACIGAANVGFIPFNATAEAVPVRTNHGLFQFVQPRPSRLIAPDAENTFQTERASSILRADYEPHGGEPLSHRCSRPIKNSSRRYRYLTSALSTVKVASTRRPWLCLRSVTSTFISLRPTATRNIATAHRLIGKPLLKLLVVSRIVLSCDRICPGIPREGCYI